jgi:hypothetical protein
MFLHKNYDIKDTDRFAPGAYPEIVNELSLIRKGVMQMPPYHKQDIIISYFKMHSLKNSWIQRNPLLTGLIVSGVFQSGHIEALFDSCRRSKIFTDDLEQYITQTILGFNKAAS